jgi:hypothetical protein
MAIAGTPAVPGNHLAIDRFVLFFPMEMRLAEFRGG